MNSVQVRYESDSELYAHFGLVPMTPIAKQRRLVEMDKQM